MRDVTQILSALEQGDPNSAAELLPLVYDELRRLAVARLADEPSGHTLQATALVHEAYLRLTDSESRDDWSGRAHFFGAAAEAMRRILVESARRKMAAKRGSGSSKAEFSLGEVIAPQPGEELLAVNDVLDEFARVDPKGAELVKLRYFAGFSMPEVAAAMQLPLRTVERHWTYAKAWLYRRLGPD
jgi:RNA polymerase sigma factor (TIGR02999 family)